MLTSQHTRANPVKCALAPHDFYLVFFLPHPFNHTATSHRRGGQGHRRNKQAKNSSLPGTRTARQAARPTQQQAQHKMGVSKPESFVSLHPSSLSHGNPCTTCHSRTNSRAPSCSPWPSSSSSTTPFGSLSWYVVPVPSSSESSAVHVCLYVWASGASPGTEWRLVFSLPPVLTSPPLGPPS